MDEKVEMRLAYEWTCPSCGRDNFERALVAELSTEDKAEMLEDLGYEPEPGEFMTRPDDVTCPHCGAEFETEEFNGPVWPEE